LPVTVPPFDQYQSPLVPLRGLWHAAPKEGDRFVNVDIQWLVTTDQRAVQFSLSGNSPVALSQIVALSVDNSRSGSPVDFVFPDSGFVLTVPARNGGVFPVFTNALMFYAVANDAIAGDETIFQILNSMSPPVMILASAIQNHTNLLDASLANGTSQIVPAGVNGTLNTISITAAIAEGASAGSAIVQLFDGTGRELWLTILNAPANGVIDPTFPLTGINLRFVNGVSVVVSGSSLTGSMAINLYYSQP
jgi:hypothetical protein